MGASYIYQEEIIANNSKNNFSKLVAESQERVMAMAKAEVNEFLASLDLDVLVASKAAESAPLYDSIWAKGLKPNDVIVEYRNRRPVRYRVVEVLKRPSKLSRDVVVRVKGGADKTGTQWVYHAKAEVIVAA